MTIQFNSLLLNKYPSLAKRQLDNNSYRIEKVKKPSATNHTNIKQTAIESLLLAQMMRNK